MYEKKTSEINKPKNYADIFTEEGMKEMARQSVNKTLFNQNRPWVISNGFYNSSPQLHQLQVYYSFWDNPSDIFGLGVYMCECFAIKPFKICFLGNGLKGFSKDWFDYCNPECVNNFRGITDKDEYIKGLHNRFPACLKDWVDAWTNNAKCNLVAIKVSEHPPDYSVTITQQRQGAMQKSATFAYSVEKNVSNWSTLMKTIRLLER